MKLKMGLPKMRIMPKMSHLTGIKKSELGLPKYTKRKKMSWRKMFKDV